jgi:serine-type D-Ala-D-Ala carboxypeptidase/endopeptidase (penicillin-binding protein 4)
MRTLMSGRSSCRSAFKRLATLALSLTVASTSSGLALFAAPAPALALARPGLAAQVSKAFRASGLRSSGTGFYVQAVKESNAISSRAANSTYMPASTMKLVTSSMALDRLGPDYRWKTVLSSESTVTTTGVLPGSIYLVGHGDPMLATRARAARVHVPSPTYLDGLADALKNKGVTTVTGNLIVDESFFDSRRTGDRWKASYVEDCGPISALTIDRNVAPNGRWESSPALAAGRRLQAMLTARHIVLRGKVYTGKVPASATALGIIKSRPLKTAIAYMNPVSDNFTAEMIAKTVAAEAYGRGTSARGAKLAAAEMKRAGVAATYFRTYDGSGLSRSDRASPLALVRLLRYSDRRPWAAVLRNSLPLAGKTGTLASRMRGTAAAGRVRAKTGSLSDASTLAGFATSRRGTVFVFSLMTNGSDVLKARAFQDSVCVLLAAYTGR